jgi:hypothetical protein
MFWNQMSAGWGRYPPPLVPTDGDVSHYRRSIENHDDHLLLMGVTPALSVLGKRLLAVDHSKTMIDTVWPGDTPERKALLGDWLRDLPHGAGFSAALTDGGLSCIRWPDQYVLVLRELRACAGPGFRFVTRCHTTAAVQQAPELQALFDEVARGENLDLEIAKHRIAHCLVHDSQNVNVALRNVAEIALKLFADEPEKLAIIKAGPQLTGTVEQSFPSLAAITTLFEAEGYAVAARQPGDHPAMLVATPR